MFTYWGETLLELCLFFRWTSQLSEVLQATGQMEHLYNISQCFSSMWVFCPWRVLKTISQWRHLEEKGSIMSLCYHSKPLILFLIRTAFCGQSLTCTRLCVHSADSFPWHASVCQQSDSGHRTQDNSKGTCGCECVGELWSCTCWVATLSKPYTSVNEEH